MRGVISVFSVMNVTFILTLIPIGSFQLVAGLINGNETNETRAACMSDSEMGVFEKMYEQTKEDLEESWTEKYLEEIVTERILVPLGFVGSILSLVVLFGAKDSEFQGPSMAYLKGVACAEILDSFLMAWALMEETLDPWSVFFYFVDKNIDGPISEAALMFADCMTAGMGMDRVLALWTPVHYRILNHWCHFIVVLVIGLLAAFTRLPALYTYSVALNPKKPGKYKKEKTDWAKSSLYFSLLVTSDVVWMILHALIFITTVAVVIGLIKIRKQQQRLIGRGNQDLDSWKQTKRLCVLLLCLSVPLIIPDAFVLCQTIVRSRIPDLQQLLNLCFDQAVSFFPLVKLESLLDSLVEFFLRLAHDSNFYLYLALNHRFRLAFLRIFCQRIAPAATRANAVAPTRPVAPAAVPGN